MQGVDASVTPSGTAVLIRFTPGACPMTQVAAALASHAITLDTARCSRVTERSVTLTRSAAPKTSPFAATLRSLQTIAATVKDDIQLKLVAIAGILLLAGAITHWVDAPALLWAPLLAASAILASTRTAPEAWNSVRTLRVNIDVLMFAAAAGAASLGHFEEGAFLLFLFGLGAAGEHAALNHAEHAISSLAELAPDTAHVINESTGETTEQTVESVHVGTTILVRPFDRIPLDGTIIDGQSAIDESTLTGEPAPVDKSIGDQVFAGTMNTAGSLRIRVTKPASESTIARIMAMVEESRANASPVERFTERVERWYVPMVFVMTAFVLALPPLLAGAEWGRSFYRSMAFMTAASPCAIAIGTPAAILCGLARAAQLGVLIKGGAFLEILGKTNAIAFDKTGTLTEGKPVVETVIADPAAMPTTLDPSTDTQQPDDDYILALAAAIEREISHPLAAAIVEAAELAELDIPKASEVTQRPGIGAEGVITIAGRAARVAVIKPSAAANLAQSDTLDHARRSLADSGASLVVVTINDKPAGIIALADAPRQGSRRVIERLRSLGITHQIMLTGDHEATAKHVAQALGIDDYHASLTPDEKLDIINQLKQTHGRVAMIGDGVNDAPALAEATVGIAMGAAGADVALETADVALMGSNLARLPDAIELSRASAAMIRQNMTIALAVITIVAPLAAAGYASLGLAVLLHEGSTVVVVLNSLRLLKFNPKTIERTPITAPHTQDHQRAHT